MEDESIFTHSAIRQKHRSFFENSDTLRFYRRKKHIKLSERREELANYEWILILCIEYVLAMCRIEDAFFQKNILMKHDVCWELKVYGSKQLDWQNMRKILKQLPFNDTLATCQLFFKSVFTNMHPGYLSDFLKECYLEKPSTIYKSSRKLKLDMVAHDLKLARVRYISEHRTLLQELARSKVNSTVSENDVSSLPLPSKLKLYLQQYWLFDQIVTHM